MNIDKFFVLQTCTIGGSYYMFSRWGRTGTHGQVKTDGPLENADEAAEMLATKFKEKTGNDEASAIDGTFKHIPGKYDLLLGDSRKREAVKWQYYVDDGVDGKRKGWHDYTPEASDIVEDIYQEWRRNPDR